MKTLSIKITNVIAYIIPIVIITFIVYNVVTYGCHLH